MQKAAVAPAASRSMVDAGADENEIVTLTEASRRVGRDPAVVFTWIGQGWLQTRGTRKRGSRTTYLVRLADVQAAAERTPRAVQKTRDEEAARLYSFGLTHEEVGRQLGLTAGGARKAAIRGGAVPRSRGAALAAVRRAQLDTYKLQQGQLDASEVAMKAGCSPITVVRHARDGDLDGLAERFAGEGWHKRHGTWLFKPEAADELRRLIGEGKRRREEAIAEARRDGRARRRKTGVDKNCPCGCERSKYLPACRADAPGYFSFKCWGRHRWQTGRVSAELIAPFGGAARRRLKLRWAPKPGRPRSYTDLQAKAVHALRDEGLGYGTISKKTNLSIGKVREILKQKKR